MGELYNVPFGVRMSAGRWAPRPGAYTGLIALSAQGAADPRAANPPGQMPVYPNGPCGSGFGAKHQTWVFDSDHGDFIVGSGDMGRDSEVDLFTYNAATKQFSPLLLRAAAGAGEATFNYSITSLSITSAGSGYTDGLHPNYSPGMPGVPLQGGTGTGAEASINVSGGVVVACFIYNSGYGYTVGDVLTATTADMGGSGSGFSVTVTGVSPAGTPSSIVGPVGRCLPGYAYDADRAVMWMEGGSPRAGFIYPIGFANNLVKGGLWALDRSVTPPVWHRQGPGVGESAAGIAHSLRFDNYSYGLFYDEAGQTLYSIVGGAVYRYPLSGLTIDGVSRDLWVYHAFPPAASENHSGFHAFDTLRRRIIFWSPNAKRTYAWNCATNTYSDLGAFDPPFNEDWHMTYDEGADRVILWIAGQYGSPYPGVGDPGYNGDYQGRRSHVMYEMDGGGSWTSFTPVGDQLIGADCQYAQFSGAYDPVNQCLVLMAANETNDAQMGSWFDPTRLVIYHLYRSAPASRPSWVTEQTAQTWRTIPASNKLSDIDPAASPTYNPNYPAAAPWAASNAGIILPWCGACYNKADDDLWIPIGYGHDDGAGNECYHIKINAETPTWIMPRPPSGAIGNLMTLDDGQEASLVYADGRPRAIHTYNKPLYVPGVGPMLVIYGGTVYRASNASSGKAMKLNETTGEWTNLAVNTNANLGGEGEFGGTAYDSLRHANYFLPKGSGIKLTRYNIAANTWAQVGPTLDTSSNAACYLPDDDCLLVFCNSFTNGIGIFDCAAETWHFPTRSGSLVGGVNLSVSTYGSVAPVWVSPIRAVAFWDNTSATTQINILTVPANPRTGDWVASQLPVSGSNTVTPTVKTPAGTYGRFQYSENLDGFLLLNGNTQDIYFYKRA